MRVPFVTGRELTLACEVPFVTGRELISSCSTIRHRKELISACEYHSSQEGS